MVIFILRVTEAVQVSSSRKWNGQISREHRTFFVIRWLNRAPLSCIICAEDFPPSWSLVWRKRLLATSCWQDHTSSQNQRGSCNYRKISAWRADELLNLTIGLVSKRLLSHDCIESSLCRREKCPIGSSENEWEQILRPQFIYHRQDRGFIMISPRTGKDFISVLTLVGLPNVRRSTRLCIFVKVTSIHLRLLLRRHLHHGRRVLQGNARWTKVFFGIVCKIWLIDLMKLVQHYHSAGDNPAFMKITIDSQEGLHKHATGRELRMLLWEEIKESIKKLTGSHYWKGLAHTHCPILR